MTPTPYLTFQGNCAEALAFYADVFGGTIDMMSKASEMPEAMPGPLPPEKADWIMHGSIAFDGGALFASDDIMGGTPPMQGASIHMDFATAAEGATAFERLAEGGEVQMPYQATFWTPGFGTLRDRFGINWMISTTEPLPEA